MDLYKSQIHPSICIRRKDRNRKTSVSVFSISYECHILQNFHVGEFKLEEQIK